MSAYEAVIAATFIVLGLTWLASLVGRALANRAVEETGHLDEQSETWVYGPREMWGPIERKDGAA